MGMHRKLIDLCCGLGGLSLAGQELSIEPILGIDNCINSLKTYETNFPKSIALNMDINCNTIEKKIENHLKINEIIKKNLYIVSGPPCQGFSVAGKRKKNDTRNNIIIRIASIIAAIKPKAAIIENVASIINPRYGNILKKVKKILKNAGFYIFDIELDSLDFGVAQRRKRRFFFITTYLIPEKEIKNYFKKYQSEAPILNDLLNSLPNASVRPEKYHDELAHNGIFNHFSMKHSKKVIQKIKQILPGTGPLSYRKLDPNKCAPTLISGHRAPPVHFKEPRSITVREAARIQSFPDTFRICGNFGSQLQQIANAVPIELGKVVLGLLLNIEDNK